MGTSTWGIVLTADEPEQLVLANVGWHLATGATEVHVYLDRPDDSLGAQLSQLPGVRVTQCGPEFWAQRRDKRPKAQTRRQTLNANDALAHANVDWLAHIDADEFLVQSTPLADELYWLRDFNCELHFPMSERFYCAGTPPQQLFEGVMRKSTRFAPDFDADLFGSAAEYLQKGMLGHAGGKSAVPTGAEFRLGIHTAFQFQAGKKTKCRRYNSRSTRLYHFDGMTPLHWLMKLVRYGKARDMGLAPASREPQLELLAQAGQNLEQMLQMHDRLRCIDPDDLARHTALGLLERTEFDPTDAIQTILGKPIDLTNKAFDEALKQRNPDLFHDTLKEAL